MAQLARHAVAKPRGLVASKDGNVVQGSGTQASCPNMQGFVDGLINKVGAGTVTP